MKSTSRQLYKITFLFTNPLKEEAYKKKVDKYAETHSVVNIDDDLPKPPEREQDTAYAAVFDSPPGEEIKRAVDLALKRVFGDDYEKYYPFVTSVEGLNSVFVEEEEEGQEKVNER